MEPKTLYFDKKLIVETFFHADIKPITINKVDVKRIVQSKKDSFENKGAFKYFIRYDDLKIGIIPLYIILRQINAYVQYFDKNNKCMNILVHDRQIIKKYNKIWNKNKRYLKKNLKVNHSKMINTLELK